MRLGRGLLVHDHRGVDEVLDVLVFLLFILFTRHMMGFMLLCWFIIV